MNKLNLIFDQVNLRSIIELIIAQTEPALVERKQTIETEGLELLPVIDADVARLHQIFKQVINNAIKYTPDGRKITVAGETVKSANNATDQVKIIVRDSGVGVAPEEREKIFEKFYRVGDSALHSTSPIKFMGAGPGLGLDPPERAGSD